MKDLVCHVQRLNLFQPGETVVVAVSGGADSVALLDVLSRISPGKLRLVVAHLNHCLRGDDSDADQRFVADLAAGYGHPCLVRRSEVVALAKEWGTSLEDAGRRERYQFFAELAEKYGAASIALAHHRDDQAETVLLRLLRGAGGTGLKAMGIAQGMLKRPLLKVARREIEQYLRDRGLSHREDASNADTSILRNSIRHELIPFLTRYNPKVSERLAITAEILAGDEELLDELTERAYRRLAEAGSEGPCLSVAGLGAEARGLRLRLYRRALADLRGDLQRIGLAHLEAIDRVVGAARPNARLKLPGECTVRRSYDRLFFAAAVEPSPPGFELEVEGEGEFPLPGNRRLRVSLVPCPAQLDAGSPRAAYLDPQRAPFPWTVRSFRPGDRFRPFGMTGSQKVKDLFINHKLSPAERAAVPLVLSRGRLIWLGGVRMGEDARVDGPSGLVLRAEILDITL